MTARWEPLGTAEEAIRAFKAGRHVEYTACGCDYQLPGKWHRDSAGWVIIEDDDLEGLAQTGDSPKDRYRALIEDSK